MKHDYNNNHVLQNTILIIIIFTLLLGYLSQYDLKLLLVDIFNGRISMLFK